MPEPVMPKNPVRDEEAPSTFATRRAEREAREAAGEVPERRHPPYFRAGLNAENPVLVVNHVRA